MILALSSILLSVNDDSEANKSVQSKDLDLSTQPTKVDAQLVALHGISSHWKQTLSLVCPSPS